MIIDLHAHYPMHLVPRARIKVLRLLRSRREGRRLSEWLRALLVGLTSPFANYRSLFSGPRVRVGYMREGGVGVALSVLYSFFDEVDVDQGARPRAGYLQSISDQAREVERHVADHHRDEAMVVHNPQELDAAQGAGRLALVHCVEGGFHLGPTPAEVEGAVKRLAEVGVAYVTLAHLIWRGVATDAPALPFFSDEEYRHWLPQPEEGLSDVGEAAVEAMVRERVLIDVSHMSERSLAGTFALLDRLDPEKSVPVLATHAGYRFGTQEYMLSSETLQRIAERAGVVGLISPSTSSTTASISARSDGSASRSAGAPASRTPSRSSAATLTASTRSRALTGTPRSARTWTDSSSRRFRGLRTCATWRTWSGHCGIATARRTAS